jgi:hypothetical protein
MAALDAQRWLEEQRHSPPSANQDQTMGLAPVAGA